MFSDVRRRLLALDRLSDPVRVAQYGFEEVCLKCMFNETDNSAPFDSDTPHWITKTALRFARIAGIPEDKVIAIIAP
jgi:hypothetical protein